MAQAFDADKSGIDEVCGVSAHLYSLPKAQYIPVCKDEDSFTFSNKPSDSQSQPVPKEVSQCSPRANDDASVSKAPPVAVNLEYDGSKGSLIKVSVNKLKESKKSDDESNSMPVEGDAKEEPVHKSKSDHRSEVSGERNQEREREREKERERERERKRIKARDCDRGRDSDQERKREESHRNKYKIKDQGHRSGDR